MSDTSKPYPFPTTGAILAGGGARRMGGVEKGLVRLAGRPMLEHVLDNLRPQVEGEVLISSSNPVYRKYGSLVADPLPGGLGPLAGILGALEQAPTEHVLVVPCDTPALPRDLLARMAETAQQTAAPVVVPGDGCRIHSAVLLIQRRMADPLRQFLQEGGRAVRAWLASVEHTVADFSDCPECFENINTGRELAAREHAMNYERPAPPVLGFAAWSGTGKTTLLEQLIPELARRGVRVSVIKHAHHDFDIDQPGKDSWRLRKAGAGQMLIASSRRLALMEENHEERDPVLSDLIARLDPAQADLVLVEGFRHEAVPKIELHRPALGKDLICPNDRNIIAVGTDAPLTASCPLPTLDLNDPAAIADFIVGRFLDGPKSGATE